MIRKANSFRFRAFTVFWLTFSFLLSVLSGAILFLRPEGSLATWTGWTALGLNKKQWEGVHAVFVLTLVVSACDPFALQLAALARLLPAEKGEDPERFPRVWPHVVSSSPRHC